MPSPSQEKRKFHSDFATLDECAAALQVTRQGIAVIEARAKKKLARGLAERGYTADVVRDVLRELESNRW